MRMVRSGRGKESSSCQCLRMLKYAWNGGRMKKRLEVIMAVLLLLGAYFFAREGVHVVDSLKAEKGEVCIVIDAGHGGC